VEALEMTDRLFALMVFFGKSRSVRRSKLLENIRRLFLS